MTLAWALGVVDVVLAPIAPPDAARRARDLGFEHLDLTCEWDGPLELPVGDRMTFPSPKPHRSCPAPPDEPGMWDRALHAYRRCPGALIEPWGGSILGSIERVRAMLAEVPGLRLLVDTGHVAAWGEDPCELLDAAGHVQLRQARRGVVQAAVDDGDVDFRRLLRQLAAVGYRGLLSVEYFDLPDRGWALDDPVGHAVALADAVRRLA